MQWLVGALVAVALGLAVQIDTQIGGLRDELRSGLAEVRAESRAEHAEIRAELRADMAEFRAEFRSGLAELREDIRRLDERLRAVEVTLGKVDQRLAALERLHEAQPAQ